MDDFVVCKVQLYKESDAAICVGKPGLRPNSVYASRDQKWIPSTFLNHSTLKAIGSVGEIEIPRWLADKKELAHAD